MLVFGECPVRISGSAQATLAESPWWFSSAFEESVGMMSVLVANFGIHPSPVLPFDSP